MRKNLIVFVLTTIFISFVSACNKSPPEEEIRENIKLAQTAIENKEASDVLIHVAQDFLGNDSVDRNELRRMLAFQFLQHQNINVILTSLDIELDAGYSDRANMRANVLVTGASRWIPEDGRALNISGVWKLLDDDWKLQVVHWE